jgi:coenzyme F420-reducing hydrogenase beta subunit
MEKTTQQDFKMEFSENNIIKVEKMFIDNGLIWAYLNNGIGLKIDIKNKSFAIFEIGGC